MYLKQQWAGLYHQFNDHVHCSSEWCKYVHIPKELWITVNKNNNNKLRNKEFDELIWNEAKAIHDLFVMNENLEMLNHGFDLQKNEALNKAFTKVAPKNMVFSKTHSLYDHLALVIVYDSIGLFECLSYIFQVLLKNDAYVLPPIEATWSKQQDKQHKNNFWGKVHQNVKECTVQNERQNLNWNKSIIPRPGKMAISIDMVMPLPQPMK